MKPLTGKVAIVTGTSAPNGIGRAIAMRLAQDGACVLATDIGGNVTLGGQDRARTVLLAQVQSDLQTLNPLSETSILDIRDADAVAATVAHAIAVHGRIDILVNNAGSTVGADHFVSTTPQQWQASFEVNLMGPMMLAQAVIPQMQAQGGGRIINIGSTGSLGAEPGFGAYTTMKHGLVGLSKTLAAEFGPDGILCNTVCPGYIATDMHMGANVRLADQNGVTVEEMKKARYAQVALRDAGLPEDVANAVAYLAGPQANYVTGINLPVSGGVPCGI